jgi:hypothetical protein
MERKDFEAFHDLAWRAAQRGRPNDPDAMALIARAQSLSGRPGDALVMLRRLAEMGIATDARDSDDFGRVRALPGWTAVEELIAAAEKRGAVTASTGPKAASGIAKPPAAAAKPEPNDDAPAAKTAARGDEPLILGDAPLEPMGLAYDGASQRFVVGDRRASKLIVADEVFKRVSDLFGVASAGLGLLTGFGIDTRRGDLWVTSSPAPGESSLHKLQLVSGRVLSTMPLPDAIRPVAISDLSIDESGSVLLLDAAGSRLLMVRAGSRDVDPAVELSVRAPASVALGGELAYLAHESGLCTVRVKTGELAEVAVAKGVRLSGFRRIRWHRGSLVGIQADAQTGSDRLVRVRLARGGTRASAVEPLDKEWSSEGSALTIAHDAAYYVARTGKGPVIRRVSLR